MTNPPFAMTSATLESEAAFSERAAAIGLDQATIAALGTAGFATFGTYAFATAYTPQSADEAPFKSFLERAIGREPSDSEFAMLRRLFFESHTLALSDLRTRVESTTDPGTSTRKLPTAERVARQANQQTRLLGVIFDPDTTPANQLVDYYVEMLETGVLSYIKPEQCCSRAHEVALVRKDTSISTDANGMLKISSKSPEASCEANTELKLRAAWQRRSLAMDLAEIASFTTVETWVQYLFAQLSKDQPRGFSKITLQVLDCDRQLFVLASHRTMGKLRTLVPGDPKPLDTAIDSLKSSTEVLQYLTPLPALRAPPTPVPGQERPAKMQKVNPTPKQGNKPKASGAASSKFQLPEGCVSHDEENRPLCFLWQQGKCKFKGPPGKRCARGFHKCYKAGCFRLKPYHLCTHAD